VFLFGLIAGMVMARAVQGRLDFRLRLTAA
jgi:hypothetical protein